MKCIFIVKWTLLCRVCLTLLSSIQSLCNVSPYHTTILLVFVTYCEEFEAQRRDNASQQANHHGTEWANSHVGTSSHGDSSSKSGILDVHLVNEIDEKMSVKVVKSEGYSIQTLTANYIICTSFKMFRINCTVMHFTVNLH